MDLGISAATRRGGFTFIEVMFAVMILGFGVIMVAVMIPVAIRQTKQTRETNSGSASVESGFHNLESLWASYDTLGQSPALGGALPSTNFMTASASVNPLGRPLVVTFPAWGYTLTWHDGNPDADNDGFSDAQELAAGTLPNDSTSFPSPRLLWETLGNRIDTASLRSAWIPFYYRQGSLPPFMALLGVQARNVDRLRGETFTNLDANPLPITFQIDQRAPYTGTSGKDDFEQALLAGQGGKVERLEPTIVRIDPAPDAAGDPVVTLAQLRQAAVEGAAIVAVNARGQIRVLTLSKPRSDLSEDHWELAPGGDIRVVGSGGALVHEFEFDPGGTDEEPVRAYIVGRMLRDPTQPWDGNDNPYIGPTQVVQVLEGKMLR